METKSKTKRVKYVFRTSQEVAHVWAQQRQDQGRNPTGNCWFEGETIYSYGRHFPVARFAGKGVVLLTTRSYSNTTAGHICDVKRALHGVTVINVYDVLANGEEAHKRNAEEMLKGIQELARKHRKAVKRDYRAELAGAIENLARYVKWSKLRPVKAVREALALINENGHWLHDNGWGALIGLSTERAAEIDTRKADAVERERAAQEKRAELDREQRARVRPLAIAAWRAHQGTFEVDGVRLSVESQLWHYSDVLPTMLRLSEAGDEVETSHGASVPLRAAKVAWAYIQRREVPPDRLGHYTPEGYSNGDFVIGCHRIPLVEIERLAGELGLIESKTGQGD